jgi:hypothetical protein
MMRHLLYLVVLCLAFLCQNIEARNSAGRVAETNDFYYNEHKQAGTMSDGSGHGGDTEDGSGYGTDDEDDEDGSGHDDDKVLEKTCMDQLQEVRDSGLLGAYEPQCEEDGTFSKVQCHGSIGQCWCADETGVRIEGTATRGRPDCEEIEYVFNIVAKFDLEYTVTVANEELYKQKIKKKLMMSFEKQFSESTVDLVINSIRPGSVIVDMDVKVKGIQAQEPTQDQLRAAVVESSVGPVKDFASSAKHATQPPPPTPEPTTKKPMMEETTPLVVIKNIIPDGEDDNDKTEQPYTPVDNTDDDDDDFNQVPGAQEPEDAEDEDDDHKETQEEKTNEIGLQEKGGKYAASTGLIGQPGLLAGVIGGAVVGLLFAVLLVMFIVYRMRKKDEGSYALDEPKSPRLNTYSKAPTKEFYA